MKGPYCETIRCETPVRQKKAGALSYFSSGSFTSGLRGAVWPDAMERRDSNTRQVKQLALDTLKHLEMRRVYRSVRGSSRNFQHVEQGSHAFIRHEMNNQMRNFP